MSYSERISKLCCGCEYARERGCLDANKRGYVHLTGIGDGITVMVTTEGIIVYYSDISYCDRWRLKEIFNGA